MFDIGFSEILVIAVVALIVIGPERLPKVARTLGHLLGRMQRYVNDVKADISREMELDELRKQQAKMQEVMRMMDQSVSEQVSAVGAELSATAGAPSDSPATEAAPPVAAQAAPQLELGLDASSKNPARNQA